LTEDLSYILCSNRTCQCKDGFSGAATKHNKCNCLPPNTVTIDETGEATCTPAQFEQPPNCSYQWECMVVSENYNYVNCSNNQCTCKDGFSGNATTDSKCDCLPPNTIVYENNEAFCVPPQTQAPGCTAIWECLSVTENYNYVNCSAGQCVCRDGFSGNATTEGRCNCVAPNMIVYQNNVAFCLPPDTQPPQTQSPQALACTQITDCQNVSENFNFVQCVNGTCQCRDGFSGNATTDSRCNCLPPNTFVIQDNNSVICRPQFFPYDSVGCTEKWECINVTADYNFVFCESGSCACKDGFSGNATAVNQCNCTAPNSVVFENNEIFCRPGN